MALSEQRRQEIRDLSNDECVDHIDTSAFTEADWSRFDAEWNEKTRVFCRESTDPESLHYFADTWNWDKGIWGLQALLDNPICEAATALLIYWRGAPEWYLQYPDRTAVEALELSNLAIFDLITAIETRYLAGEFPSGSQRYDPRRPGEEVVGQYSDMLDNFVRALPARMYEPAGPPLAPE